MKRIYLLALLIAVASANLAVDINDLYLSHKTFRCLKNQNVSKVILELSNERGHINQHFLSHFIYAKHAGISTIDAIVIVNDTLTANSLSAKVADTLPNNFNGTVWLRVMNSPHLWSRKMALRIFYLGDLVTSFRQRDLNVGISGDAATWESVFGFKRAGCDTLKAVPVGYACDNSAQSFDDFSSAGFGTWTQPALKSFQNNAHICGTRVASLDYYQGVKLDWMIFMNGKIR